MQDIHACEEDMLVYERKYGFFELHDPMFRFGLKHAPLDMDADGYLHLPTGPGLGVKLDWDWIDNNTVETISGAPS